MVERPPDYKVVWSGQLQASLVGVSAFCDEVGCRKVLVLGPRTKVDLSVVDIFDLGRELAKLSLQIAVVELHDASKEDVKFLEDVTKNRGLPIRFFDNELDAKVWLEIA